MRRCCADVPSAYPCEEQLHPPIAANHGPVSDACRLLECVFQVSFGTRHEVGTCRRWLHVDIETGITHSLNVSLFDLRGRLVHAFEAPTQDLGGGRFRWNVAGVPAGVYVVRISTDGTLLPIVQFGVPMSQWRNDPGIFP